MRSRFIRNKKVNGACCSSCSSGRSCGGSRNVSTCSSDRSRNINGILEGIIGGDENAALTTVEISVAPSTIAWFVLGTTAAIAFGKRI